MNKLTKVLTTLTMSLTVVGMANASTLIAKDNSIATELCMKAASGNRVSMNNAILDSGLSRTFVVYNVKCNNTDITDFVEQYGKKPEKMNALLNRGRTEGDVTIHDLASL